MFLNQTLITDRLIGEYFLEIGDISLCLTILSFISQLNFIFDNVKLVPVFVKPRVLFNVMYSAEPQPLLWVFVEHLRYKMLKLS